MVRSGGAIALLVVVAALLIGACGGSSTNNSSVSGTLKEPGLYGKLPPAGTPTHGGTITYGQLNGNTPNYIFPIVPSGNASTNNYAWQQVMCLPLYNNFPYGGSPGVNFSVSLANKPVFTDGDKTVTITMKQGYKWNDGKPVDAQDLLFDVALIKAAVKESAANWGSFTPGYFPDSLASISAPSQYTVVMHLKHAFNPGFFLNDQLAANVVPLPSSDVERRHRRRAAPRTGTSRRTRRRSTTTSSKAGGQVGTFGTNPLWKIADGPFVLKSFSPVTARGRRRRTRASAERPSRTSASSRASPTPGSRRC